MMFRVVVPTSAVLTLLSAPGVIGSLAVGTASSGVVRVVPSLTVLTSACVVIAI